MGTAARSPHMFRLSSKRLQVVSARVQELPLASPWRGMLLRTRWKKAPGMVATGVARLQLYGVDIGTQLPTTFCDSWRVGQPLR
jgi:hypothetical protein